MSAILPCLKLDSNPTLSSHIALHQIHWIEDEYHLHAEGKQVCALAEKSNRIGWTYADAFKNVRKRLRFKKRDYLFATKDYPSALEYMQLAWQFAELFNLTKTILSRGEESLQIPRLDPRGRSNGFTDEIKVGVIKFDTGSRIIAFSSNPQAMAVYGGDVGLDEFAKHPNARQLWETAQGRAALGHDLAVWSSHDGEDTLFYQFAQQARSTCLAAPPPPPHPAPALALAHAPSPFKSEISIPSSDPPPIENQKSKIKNLVGSPIEIRKSKIENPGNTNSSPWNLYFRVTMPDALELGFLDIINRAKGTHLQPDQFLADCRNRAGLPEIFEQAYLCNPAPAAESIVDWSAIERCRADYPIGRLHLDHDQIQLEFGPPLPHLQMSRAQKIESFLHRHFPSLFGLNLNPNPNPSLAAPTLAFSIEHSALSFRLGFDIAASGHGNLACLYIDAATASDLCLCALLTTRTDDWHFLKTVLFTFLRFPNLRGAGDASGLGRQICWEAANHFGENKFLPVNFGAKKSDLGFRLMNELATAQKRFPSAHQDIAADFFALRKHFTGSKWLFTEGKNPYNPASHCDIAWAAALASEAHAQKRSTAWALVG